MPRPKEFDPDAALDRAMDLFWRQGYDGTSLGDLLEHMQISRQSLYDTFGDKHRLFLAVMDRYQERTLDMLSQRLHGPDVGLDAIREHFERSYDFLFADRERGACLMANTSLELGLLDDDARDRVRRHLKSLENAFLNAVRNAIDRGEVSSDRDARALARFLTSSFHGLGIMARGGASKRALRDVIDVTLDALV